MPNEFTASDKTTHNSKLPGHCEAYVPTPQTRLAALLLEDIDVLQSLGNMSLTSAPFMLEVPAKRRKLHLGQSEVCRERDPCEPVAADTQERLRNLISPEICYGSLDEIPLQPPDDTQCHHDLSLLSWDGSNLLTVLSGTGASYKLPRRAMDIFQTLTDKANVQIDIRLHVSDPEPPKGLKRRIKKVGDDTTPLLSATANLYGPRGSSASVSAFLQSCHAFLQAPDRCTYDVPYINPQCLSSPDDDVVLTSVFNADPNLPVAGGDDHGNGLFDELGNDEEFEEAPQPNLVRSRLKGYQRQGLRFLLDREQGWDLGGKREDVWKSYKDRFGWSRYKNNINGLTQGEPPKDFRGGILADEMGLGKTLTMLALTAAARDPTAECTCQVGEESFETQKPLGTLIVVPLSLLVVWDDQIEEHMAPEFKRLIYHGASRKSSRARFSQFDVVITTYNVVAAEWKDFKRSRPERSSRPNLITSKWHRVILDEAHMIRSPDTQNAKAACALDAAHRWCITGTPLQNRTQDIFSLLKFLRVYPYDSFKVFDRDITKPCKVQVEERGLQMLRKLMRMVTLHRGKKVIELPTLQEAIEEVEMTPAEQSMYEEARDGTRRFIKDVLCSQGPAQGSSYINAFRRVNKMRYICNHGIQHRDRRLHPNQSSEADDETEGRINELDHILDNLDEACFLCGTDVTDAQESCAMIGIPTSVEDSQQRICVGCSRQKLQLPNNDVDDPVTPQLETTLADTEPLLPSKVGAIASYVKRIPAGEKCVIFSFWTSTLDIMQRALTNSGISSCRYQGNMKYAVRTESLRRFSEDETIKAILISISCGGQGLNLTVANHCILVEPQWNPMVEEQAIARVHRLGQNNAVSVARFVMKGTIERKVLERQTRKKVLADLVLGRERIKEGENGKKQLANLMQLIY